MKVAILGGGAPIGSSLVRRLIDQGIEVVSSEEVNTKHLDGLDELGRVIEHKLHNNFLGDVVIPRKPRESRTYEPKRKTGAAAIKRASKKAKRRK